MSRCVVDPSFSWHIKGELLAKTAVPCQGFSIFHFLTDSFWKYKNKTSVNIKKKLQPVVLYSHNVFISLLPTIIY